MAPITSQILMLPGGMTALPDRSARLDYWVPLDEILARPLKLTTALPAPGSHLLIGGYSQSQLHVMTADRNCQLIKTLLPLLC